MDLLENKKVFIDETGREFFYVFIHRPKTAKVIVHFSAFFGDWGDRKEYKEIYQGYFHRLKMFGPEEEYSTLFLCDQYGATKNGTYYLGERGDLFVEKATSQIIESIFNQNHLSFDQTVMVGSSMGATAALKFGLKYHVKGIVTVCPHIDLDICAAKQGREIHVKYICPDEDIYEEKNFPYTRKVRNMLQEVKKDSPLPVLFMQSCEDDYGVHFEQVVPYCNLWKEKGGTVFLDARKEGGHTSDFAHKKVLLNVINTIFSNQKINLKELQSFAYLPEQFKTFSYRFDKKKAKLKSFIKQRIFKMS